MASQFQNYDAILNHKLVYDAPCEELGFFVFPTAPITTMTDRDYPRALFQCPPRLSIRFASEHATQRQKRAHRSKYERTFVA